MKSIVFCCVSVSPALVTLSMINAVQRANIVITIIIATISWANSHHFCF